MPVRGLEARSAFAEINFARDACVDHPLQRAVDRGAADAGFFAVDAVDELVRAEVAFLPEEHGQNPIALARTLSPGGTKSGEVWELTIHHANW